jgi:FkbM family methyltransferase
MTVVDIGANIGAHTLGFARAVGEMGNVIAFEPQRVVFETLCANLALNALFHVRPLMSGVGRERGAAALPAIDPRQKRNFGGISLGAAGTEAVPVTPLDALGLKACHLVKIDVEGMEGDVIAGAAETIGRCRPLLYLENDRRDKSAALIAQAMGLGYRLYWHLPPLYNPANWYANAENVFGRVLSVNLLALPQEAVVKVEGLRPVSGPEDKADHW